LRPCRPIWASQSSYTYHYLSAAPQLLAHAAGLLDAAQEVAP